MRLSGVPTARLAMPLMRTAPRACGTSTLRASGTLNALSRSGCAASSSASAAAANVSGVAGAPVSTASARPARQGTWATPPSATRASRIVSPSSSTAAATEKTAKENDARSRTLR